MSDRKPTPDIMGDILGSASQARSLRIADMRRDGGTQPRDGVNEAHVQDLVNVLEQGETLPPVEVYFDGESYWLYDGYHRTEAHSRLGKYTIMADIRQGTLEDAQWASYSVNKAHGLKRTNEDKKRAVVAALKHPNAVVLSNVQIAKHVGVDAETVRFYRIKMEETSEIRKSDTRTGADGRTINTSGISDAAAAKAKRGGLTKADYAHDVLAPLVFDWLHTYADRKGRPWQMIADSAAHSNSIHWQEITAEFDRREIYWDDDTLKDAIKQAIDTIASVTIDTPAAAAAAQQPSTDDWRPPGFGARSFGTGSTAPGGLSNLQQAAADRDARAAATGAWQQSVPTPTTDNRAYAVAAGLVPADQTADSSQLPANITIHNADSRDLLTLGIKPVHLVITSPPYNVGIDYADHNDTMTLSAYRDLLYSVLTNCHEFMVDGARIAVVVPFGVGRNPWVPFASEIMHLLGAAKFTLRGQIIWDKGSSGNRTSWGSFRLPSDPSLRDTTEAIIVAHKGSSKLEIPEAEKESDGKGTYTAALASSDYFMELAQDHWCVSPESASRVGHPAPFPVELARRLIDFYAYPGAHVLDPFGGSGTTAIAAHAARCDATLVEISADYCQLAKERIANAQ